MPDTDRAMPPIAAGEQATLEGWLDFYRTTLLMKCAGLTGSQLRTAAAEPSVLTLQGIVQHMAEVERHWFQRVLLGNKAPGIYAEVGPDGHDQGFEVSEAVSFEAARETWQGEVETAKANRAGRSLDATSSANFGEVSLRWIYNHMIAEYARHCGHADLIRERIDGSTGV